MLWAISNGVNSLSIDLYTLQVHERLDGSRSIAWRPHFELKKLSTVFLLETICPIIDMWHSSG
jgi:hypothetical protein